jgi:hypothetical protein
MRDPSLFKWRHFQADMGDVESRYAIPIHPRSEATRFCQLRKHYFHHIVEILDLADFDRRAVRLAVPSEGGGLASLPSIVIIRAQVRIISFTK